MLSQKAKRLSLVARTSLGGLVVVCLLAGLFPLAVVARAFGLNTGMSCCAGKKSGHCDSGMMQKPRPKPKPEPMCGLKQTATPDSITIIAESGDADTSADSGTSAATPSMSGSCKMDCCATVNSVQTKREKSTTTSTVSQVPPANVSWNGTGNSLRPAFNERFNYSDPRGPPALF